MEASDPGPAPETARGRTEVIEPSQVQTAFARRVAESKATAPHVYLGASARPAGPDASRRLGPLIVRLAARALRDHPMVNAAYRDGRFELYSRVNVAVQVPTGGSVVTPVIHDADEKDRNVIADELEQLTARAQEGEITRPELSGATFTIAGLGWPPLDSLAPIIHAGQAAALGVAVTSGGSLNLMLSCDQRILQGTEGAEFLARLCELLENPGAD